MLNRIKKIAKENPNKIAYQVDNETLTYQELWNESKKYAELLKREGTSPVIIYGHKEKFVVISILACLFARRTYIPIGICTPEYRIHKIVEMTHSTLLLTNYQLSVDDMVCCSLQDLEKYQLRPIKEQSNTIAYMIFTSGSTGKPKGVPISYDNLNNFINWICSLKPLSTYHDICVLNQASFSFDLSVADFYYSLCNGHTLLALNSNFDSDYKKTYRTIKQSNVMVITPTFIKLCLLDSSFSCKNYPNLKCIYFCGEPLEPKTVQKLFSRFPDIHIINAYGPTEATSAVSASQITPEMSNLSILPVGDCDSFATPIEIRNNEIVLKGPSVFHGYLENVQGGYSCIDNVDTYYTGDIGYIKDGKLYCKGRKNSFIKYKGYRIELNDIEANINDLDGIYECAVVVKYDESEIVKTIKAFVVLDENVSLDYIKEELGKRIPKYMIPKTIKILEKLPVNQNGKIDRKALSEL